MKHRCRGPCNGICQKAVPYSYHVRTWGRRTGLSASVACDTALIRPIRLTAMLKTRVLLTREKCVGRKQPIFGQKMGQTSVSDAVPVDAAFSESSPGRRWQVAGVRTGVRALPPRDQHGSLPLAGRVPGEHNLWLVGGLGARGLVYHAWLGRLMARAVLSGDDMVFSEQLRRWQK